MLIKTTMINYFKLSKLIKCDNTKFLAGMRNKGNSPSTLPGV